MRRALFVVVAFCAGWAVGGISAIGLAAWRVMRDMDVIE